MLLIKVGIGFISEKKRGGREKRKSLNNVETLLWLAEPPFSLYVCVLCKQWGLGSFIPSIIKPVSYIRVLCLLIISQTTTKGKSSQTGSIKCPGTHPPLSRCHSSSPLPPGQLLSQSPSSCICRRFADMDILWILQEGEKCN